MWLSRRTVDPVLWLFCPLLGASVPQAGHCGHQDLSLFYEDNPSNDFELYEFCLSCLLRRSCEECWRRQWSCQWLDLQRACWAPNLCHRQPSLTCKDLQSSWQRDEDSQEEVHTLTRCSSWFLEVYVFNKIIPNWLIKHLVPKGGIIL